MKAEDKATLAQIQSELRKYEQAQLKMEGHETKLNAYLKSKIIHDSQNLHFDDDEISLSDLAGDGLCFMFVFHGMHIKTAIRKIREDGDIYTSKITNIDLSF